MCQLLDDSDAGHWNIDRSATWHWTALTEGKPLNINSIYLVGLCVYLMSEHVKNSVWNIVSGQ